MSKGFSRAEALDCCHVEVVLLCQSMKSFPASARATILEFHKFTCLLFKVYVWNDSLNYNPDPIFFSTTEEAGQLIDGARVYVAQLQQDRAVLAVALLDTPTTTTATTTRR